jgi:hypothetical protein
MNDGQYLAIIPSMALSSNHKEILKVREMFEEQTKATFNANAVVAVESIRVFLKQLGMPHEPIADRECTVSEYAQIILAFARTNAKDGMIRDALYNFMDNYNFGTEHTELIDSVIELAEEYTVELGL